MFKGKKGFTLIELLVVIAIIGVLAGLVIVRIGTASKDARNSKRKSDMNQIKTAIEQFKAKGGSISTLAATDGNLVKSTVEAATGCFPTAVSSQKPSSFLAGDEYPKDPQDPTKYYTIACTTPGSYIISANDTAGDGTDPVPDVVN